MSSPPSQPVVVSLTALELRSVTRWVQRRPSNQPTDTKTAKRLVLTLVGDSSEPAT